MKSDFGGRKFLLTLIMAGACGGDAFTNASHDAPIGSSGAAGVGSSSAGTNGPGADDVIGQTGGGSVGTSGHLGTSGDAGGSAMMLMDAGR